MNFLAAIKHAVIGYGIRRKGWNPTVSLVLRDDDELHWSDETMKRVYNVPYGPEDSVCEFHETDNPFNLSLADIQAEDWETV